MWCHLLQCVKGNANFHLSLNPLKLPRKRLDKSITSSRQRQQKRQLLTSYVRIAMKRSRTRSCYFPAEFSTVWQLSAYLLEILTLTFITRTTCLPYLSPSLPRASMRFPCMRRWLRLDLEYSCVSRWKGRLLVSLFLLSALTWSLK